VLGRDLPAVLSVGRLVPRKGVAELIEAMAAVPARLVVVGGPGPGDLDADPEVRRLRAVARDHGVAPRLELLGHRGRDAMPTLVARADVVACVPWYEPFGIVPLEAMACGVPVVATAVGGLTDTVRDGSTGVLVPPRRPPELAEALRGLLADPASRHAMGRRGREVAEAEYTWTSVAERTEAVYRRVLAERMVDLRAAARVAVGS
jgi:glycosyltransferase involved in cell wall biosynthesis